MLGNIIFDLGQSTHKPVRSLGHLPDNHRPDPIIANAPLRSLSVKVLPDIVCRLAWALLAQLNSLHYGGKR